MEFFGTVFPISKKIQFKLGYFSSNSISTLAYGFAQFIFKGGTIDFLINHFVTNEDYKLLNNEIELDKNFYNSIEDKIITDLAKLNDVLTKRQVKHFYNCLRYLIDNKRLNIVPVTTYNGEISHYKEALFWDENNDIINIVGSCNFTYKGIICNGESFIINRSWGEESERANIKNEVEEYKTIFNKNSQKFIYINSDKLINVINENSVSMSIKQLLEEETSLMNSDQNKINDEELTRINQVSFKLKQDFDSSIINHIFLTRMVQENIKLMHITIG